MATVTPAARRHIDKLLAAAISAESGATPSDSTTRLIDRIASATTALTRRGIDPDTARIVADLNTIAAELEEHSRTNNYDRVFTSARHIYGATITETQRQLEALPQGTILVDSEDDTWVRTFIKFPGSDTPQPRWQLIIRTPGSEPHSWAFTSSDLATSGYTPLRIAYHPDVDPNASLTHPDITGRS